MTPEQNGIVRWGVVIIGRNPGERLGRSLASVAGFGVPVVYADSGSSDGSEAKAAAVGVEVVRLELGAGFTAARGRNEGLARLRSLQSECEVVQFVDGDCEIDRGWPREAIEAMARDASIGVVCGRLREKDREKSVYAKLCDMDWDGPVGEIAASGGIAMVRVAALDKAGGWDGSLATGEELELCGRLRKAGFKTVRIAAPMGEHDALMLGFADWWKRTRRVGYGYAEAAARKGAKRDASKNRRIASSVLWAGMMPLVLIVCACAAWRWPWMSAGAAGAALAYGVLFQRMQRFMRRRGRPARDARLFALFGVLAKWPHLAGHLRYWIGARP